MPTPIANAISEDLHCRAVRTELQNIGAIFLGRGGVGFVDIRSGAHGDEHFLAVWCELNIACPVARACG